MELKKIKKVLMCLVMVALGASAYCVTDYKNVLWDEYVVLRDAVYNSQKSADNLIPLYKEARLSSCDIFSGDSALVALSRCEYIMGRAYAYEDKKEKAGEYYDRGADYAKKALDMNDSAPARLMYAENISQNCSVKPVSYAVTMGTKVGGFAKDVLNMDPSNGAALYMKSAQHIYAPAPFHNYKKGIKEMKDILEMKDVHFEKDDLFNITSAIGYGYMGKKEFDEAVEWMKKALTYYPNNAYVNGLVKDINNN